MIIKKISASNFKSYDGAETSFEFDDHLNIIVGENNSGKSNLIKLFQMFVAKMTDSQAIQLTDRHDKSDRPVHAHMTFLLETDDISYLMERLSAPSSFKEDFTKLFGKEFHIDIDSPLFSTIKIDVICGDLKIKYDRMFIHGPVNAQQDRSLEDLIKSAESQKQSLYEVIIQALEQEQSDVSYGIRFKNKGIFEPLADLLRSKVVALSEFRERSGTQPSEVLSSPTGEHVSAVLFNLKNGTPAQIKRFKTIQTTFSSIFPNLKLDVNKQQQILLIKSNDIEVSHEHIGAGIVEIIILLIHLIDYKNYVFMLDEPELHLHPHAKRMVAKIIQESSKKNQIICITHSPEFVRLDDFRRIILVKDANGRSKVVKSGCIPLNDEEINKLLRIVDTDQKDFLFARKVLLVEGDTELGAMPTLSQKHGCDFDFLGISLLNVGGNYFAPYVSVLKGFELPYLVMCDKDVLVNISLSIEIGRRHIRTSSIINQLNKLNELSDAEKQTIVDLEKEIVEIPIENRCDNKENSSQTTTVSTRAIYNDQAFSKLLEIVHAHSFAVLTSDFEGVFKKSGYEQVLNDARKEFGRSKVLQGKYLAQEVKQIPDEIGAIIEKISK